MKLVFGSLNFWNFKLKIPNLSSSNSSWISKKKLQRKIISSLEKPHVSGEAHGISPLFKISAQNNFSLVKYRHSSKFQKLLIFTDLIKPVVESIWCGLFFTRLAGWSRESSAGLRSGRPRLGIHKVVLQPWFLVSYMVYRQFNFFWVGALGHFWGSYNFPQFLWELQPSFMIFHVWS